MKTDRSDNHQALRDPKCDAGDYQSQLASYLSTLTCRPPAYQSELLNHASSVMMPRRPRAAAKYPRLPNGLMDAEPNAEKNRDL